jgi:hypothetical protein
VNAIASYSLPLSEWNSPGRGWIRFMFAYSISTCSVRQDFLCNVVTLQVVSLFRDRKMRPTQRIVPKIAHQRSRSALSSPSAPNHLSFGRLSSYRCRTIFVDVSFTAVDHNDPPAEPTGMIAGYSPLLPHLAKLFDKLLS